MKFSMVGMLSKLGVVGVLAVVFLASTGWSQVPPLPIQIVVPNEFADREAPSFADNLPPSYRLQQIYAAEEFASLPPGKQLITRARWRTDGNLDVPRTVSADQWDAHLSTTPKDVAELDQQFAANVGDDETVVYDGPVSWQIIDADPAGGPRDFEFDLAFQKAFAYDPRQGNLLLDLSIRGGSEQLGLDFIVDATETTAFIWTGWTGNAEMDHTDGTTVGGHVVEYTFVSPDCNSDGLMDVRDANCATVQTLDAILGVAGLIAGDADGLDGVDFNDFVILADHFGAPGAYTDGDFDLDGTVQFGDFVVLANNFGQSAAGAASVPEPSTSILGTISVGALLALRRRFRSARRHIGNTDAVSVSTSAFERGERMV